MKKLIGSTILASLLAISGQADVLDNTTIEGNIGSYSLDGDNVNDLMVGMEARKAIIEIGSVDMGIGAAVSFADNHITANERGSVLIGDAYVSAETNLTKDIKGTAIMGYSAGKIDRSHLDGMTVGMGLEYTACCNNKSDMVVGVDWKRTIDVNSKHIPEMDKKNFDRYALSVGQRF